jgi:hypothetical protein
MLATFFFLALYMQRILDYSAIENGLAFLPISVAVILAAGLVSRLMNRFGFKPLLVARFALISGALVWVALLANIHHKASYFVQAALDG